ncbi:hypothetical protein AGMMS49949_04890 [Alphaproteobacteria bacterium]|nr:hypothetical protein AGMMS49949_04890 [Alphaproteobacteria bacterium]GHS96469.1 hypothetical protein AGMMS50296_2630 [Alphaproteobacteria bacterium]
MNRYNAVKDMAVTIDATTASVKKHKIDKIATLLTGGSHSIESLATLGFPGDSIGQATAYSRLNEISYLVLQCLLDDNIGAPTDTPLSDTTTTLWGRIRWLESLTVEAQVARIQKLMLSLLQSKIKAVQTLAGTLGENSCESVKSKSLALDPAVSVTEDDLLELLEEVDLITSVGEPTIETLQKVRTALEQAKTARKVYDKAETEGPVDLPGGFTKNDADINALTAYKDEVLPCWDLIQKKRADGNKTLFTKLEQTLGKSSELDATAPYTLCSLLALFQSCLRGTASLIDPITLTKLNTQLEAVNTFLNGLIADIAKPSSNYIINLTNGNADQNLKEAINDLYKVLKDEVAKLTIAIPGDLKDSKDSPVSANSAIADALALIRTSDVSPEVSLPTDPLPLGPLVEKITSTLPKVFARIENTTGVIKDLTIGKIYKMQGETLLSCLYGIFRDIFIDPVFSKIGRSTKVKSGEGAETVWVDQAPPSYTLLGTLPSSINTDKLVLLYNLLEKCPAIGSLKNTPAEGSKMLVQVMDSTMGEKNLTTAKFPIKDSDTYTNAVQSYFKIIHDNINKLLTDPIKTALFITEGTPWFANAPWFRYEKILDLLTHPADFPKFQKDLSFELFSTPVLFTLEGVPGVSNADSLKAKITASTDAEKGTEKDSWQRIETPTFFSAFNFVKKIVTEGSIFLTGADGPNGVRTKFLEGLGGLETISVPNIYNLANVFYTKAKTLLNAIDTKHGGDSVIEAFAAKKAATLAALDVCKTKGFPISYYEILTRLQKISNTTPLGEPDDHPLDIRCYSYLNGVLFECGAQLLCNLIGSATNPRTSLYGTLFAQLGDLEDQACKAAGTNTETKAAILEKRRDIQTTLNAIVGRIKYFHSLCVVHADPSESKFEALNTAIKIYRNAANNLFTTAANPTPWAAFLKTVSDLFGVDDALGN